MPQVVDDLLESKCAGVTYTSRYTVALLAPGRCGGGLGAGMSDEHYRAFVSAVANGDERPSELILNRSPEHAAVILEFIFRKATRSVHILTNSLLVSAYGCEGVVSAARNFLDQSPDAEISILAEKAVNRASHPLLQALDADGNAGRVSLRFIPAALQAQYEFNFAVADGESYRFESARSSAEAVVLFRDESFGRSLDRKFKELSASAVDDLP